MTACNHVIAHWATPEQRQQLVDAIGYARRIGDLSALPLLLIQLTEPCQTRTTETLREMQRNPQ